MNVLVLHKPERTADIAKVIHDVTSHGIKFNLTGFQFAEIKQLINKL